MLQKYKSINMNTFTLSERQLVLPLNTIYWSYREVMVFTIMIVWFNV